MDSEEIQGSTASSYFNVRSLRFASEVVHEYSDGKESSKVTPGEKTFTYDKGPRSFTSGTLLSYEGVKTRFERKCIFCSNNHWSDECQQYPDIKSRKNKLKDRCLKYMKLDHKVRECKVQDKICVHCGENDKHHRTLCPKKFNQDEDQKK